MLKTPTHTYDHLFVEVRESW